MEEITLPPIWIYQPQCKKRGRNGAEFRRPVDIHLIMAYPEVFGNITSRKVFKYTVAYNVDARYDGPNSAYGRAFETAMILEKNPKEVIRKVVGTTDKRTKKYKDFIRQVNEYNAWYMQNRLEGK